MVAETLGPLKLHGHEASGTHRPLPLCAIRLCVYVLLIVVSTYIRIWNWRNLPHRGCKIARSDLAPPPLLSFHCFRRRAASGQIDAVASHRQPNLLLDLFFLLDLFLQRQRRDANEAIHRVAITALRTFRLNVPRCRPHTTIRRHVLLIHVVHTIYIWNRQLPFCARGRATAAHESLSASITFRAAATRHTARRW